MTGTANTFADKCTVCRELVEIGEGIFTNTGRVRHAEGVCTAAPKPTTTTGRGGCPNVSRGILGYCSICDMDHGDY